MSVPKGKAHNVALDPNFNQFLLSVFCQYSTPPFLPPLTTTQLSLTEVFSERHKLQITSHKTTLHDPSGVFLFILLFLPLTSGYSTQSLCSMVYFKSAACLLSKHSWFSIIYHSLILRLLPFRTQGLQIARIIRCIATRRVITMIFPLELVKINPGCDFCFPNGSTWLYIVNQLGFQ